MMRIKTKGIIPRFEGIMNNVQKTGEASFLSRWKEAVLLVIIVSFIALFAVFIVGKKGAPVKVISEGDAAPDFSLPALDNRVVRLSDFRGRVVMLHFWATWCPPCVEEMPGIEQLYKAFKDSGLEILAVSVDEDGASAVSPFMKKNNLTFPVLLDRGRRVASGYGTFKFPETYVIDRGGIVRFKAIGSLDWTHPANMERIRTIVMRQ